MRSRFSSPAGRLLSGDRASQLDAGLSVFSFSRRSCSARDEFLSFGAALPIGGLAAVDFSLGAPVDIFCCFGAPSGGFSRVGAVDVDADVDATGSRGSSEDRTDAGRFFFAASFPLA